jgi:hypothetical protein
VVELLILEVSNQGHGFYDFRPRFQFDVNFQFRYREFFHLVICYFHEQIDQKDPQICPRFLFDAQFTF